MSDIGDSQYVPTSAAPATIDEFPGYASMSDLIVDIHHALYEKDGSPKIEPKVSEIIATVEVLADSADKTENSLSRIEGSVSDTNQKLVTMETTISQQATMISSLQATGHDNTQTINTLRTEIQALRALVETLINKPVASGKPVPVKQQQLIQPVGRGRSPSPVPKGKEPEPKARISIANRIEMARRRREQAKEGGSETGK